MGADAVEAEPGRTEPGPTESEVEQPAEALRPQAVEIAMAGSILTKIARHTRKPRRGTKSIPIRGSEA